MLLTLCVYFAFQKFHDISVAYKRLADESIDSDEEIELSQVIN